MCTIRPECHTSNEISAVLTSSHCRLDTANIAHVIFIGQVTYSFAPRRIYIRNINEKIRNTNPRMSMQKVMKPAAKYQTTFEQALS